MKNKQIINLSKNYMFQEFEIDRFDKNIILELDEKSTAIISCGEDSIRVESNDSSNFAKKHKEFIGKQVNMIIYTKSKIENILWGIGGVKNSEHSFGMNGSYNFKIDNFKRFKNFFGSNVDVVTFKVKLLDEISTYFKKAFSKYIKQNKTIEEMETNKKQFEENLLDAFMDLQELTDIGIKIIDLKIESFIEN